MIEGVELPESCAPYDPDAAMAENERYRERMPLDEDIQRANAATVTALAAALDALSAAGDVSTDAVDDALRSAGLTDARVRQDYSRILFGVGAPAGGCIFGEVAADNVSVETGGYIMDGGCLPAQ